MPVARLVSGLCAPVPHPSCFVHSQDGHVSAAGVSHDGCQVPEFSHPSQILQRRT